MKTIVKNTAILLAITLIAGIALSFVYQLTKEPIAAAEQAKKAETYKAVYADAATFTEVKDSAGTLSAFNATLPKGTAVQEVNAANAASGERLGYVFTVTAVGYGGEMKIAYGVDKTGKVVGYRVMSHSESPGYGAKCNDPDVVAQFSGLTAADQLDGITGATYTTNALKNSVRAAIDLTKTLEGGSGS